LVALLSVLCASEQLTSAFVVNWDEAGRARHWQLVPPDPSVHPNVLNRVSGAIRYYLASDAYSVTNATAELNAVRSAFAQWQAVPGGILRFEEMPVLAPGVDVNVNDNTNVFFWARTSTLVNGGTDSLANVLAFTYTATFEDNTIAEVDTVFNGVDFRWLADFNRSQTASYSIEATALHEVGHWVGLDHSALGGATMFVRGSTGIGTQAGLSKDEIAAVHSLYGEAGHLATLAGLKGRVIMNGGAVFGAMVVAEDAAGNAIVGSVSRTNGTYELLGLPPGNYSIRASPLDSSGAVTFLIKGINVSVFPISYNAAQTGFLPLNNTPVSLTAGVTTELDLSVTEGAPPLHVTRLMVPTTNPAVRAVLNAPVSVRRGQTVFVGVYSPDLSGENPFLTVSGNDVTVGTPTYIANATSDRGVPLHLIFAEVAVAPNATPGLRTFVIGQGGNTAFANGFLEIEPTFYDFDFDGLDDLFQRRYFPLFTVAEAEPAEDPDGDGFSNTQEFEAGTVPTDSSLFPFRIQSLVRSPEGTRLTFQTGVGRRYQLWSRDSFLAASWQTVGAPFPAIANISELIDPRADDQSRFYQVQRLAD
jgi:hypothetical protein